MNTPRLSIGRTEVATELLRLIARAKALGEATGEPFKDGYRRWAHFAETYLEKAFSDDSLARGFRSSLCAANGVGNDYDLTRTSVRRGITQLQSIHDRLRLYDEPTSGGTAPSSTTFKESKRRRVFVIHGRDEAAREKVARFLERLGLEAVILREQVNRGATIIEKIEANSQVHFAVAVVTADDVGALKGTEAALQPRARQNVILELGYFLGLLGRKNVCMLYEPGVELPSDWLGVGWHALDDAGAWRIELAKELQEAGIDIDTKMLLKS